MMPWPGLLEPFTECLGLGVIAATCLNYMFGVNVVLFLILNAAVWFLCDLMLIKTIEVHIDIYIIITVYILLCRIKVLVVLFIAISILLHSYNIN